MSKKELSIFWFRRDLRFQDNVGLYHALNDEYPVLPIFIFDKNILDELPKDDARVTFIHETAQKLRSQLQEKHDSSLAMFHGTPEKVFDELCGQYNIKKVFTNRDYESYALKRDAKIKANLANLGIEFHDFKDQVIFEKDDVVKNDDSMYLVFTPYMKKWKKVFEDYSIQDYNSENYLDNCYKNQRLPNLSLSDINFEKSTIEVKDYQLDQDFIKNYNDTRDLPAIEGTSRLSPHLRFGTVGCRNIIKKALESSEETFLNELIWREFYKAILHHFPETETRAFKPKYDGIKWRNDKSEFEKWKKGETGYPIVDAGMRQLNETGWMHNRVRMIVGSFLCKHLLIDWRWGEAYFAEKLLDYEMSSNLGGWQWVAGCGVDAAPYFRIFNPESQTSKFDKDKKYIKKWVLEFDTNKYVEPIVNHKEARERCLETYKSAVKAS
ncbi:MAG: cryptochrome/photolyase family protein [Psychroflexus sp.]|uniref:cryptochrome/photolyase family protein n=1 Tax=Psychroflexus sp. S27 TaxID=1982757 RepID=UPI000C2A15C0|nr:deoxyribodipyrimidine photo-lyase [Psychroflexus sp. S27]PJX24536.1 deoxyribodipyrimidine photolyase [Psychroflexus sp. S27]